jgi:hypothetical protein
MYGNGVVDLITEFHEKALVPSSLVGRISHGHVFSLCGVLRDSFLFSQRPAYSTISEDKDITGGGVSVVSLC